ncbi:glycosyltransferase [Ottowia testudinis]|uniref:Glycosyltransferase n=1 Tax=Ottowia testudinis TaxID=2816950 RepID=A0A975CKU3_9BURK|nr:glycosyltransferase [Ottowia testudinis]QTD46049.1 glycosyltransferase [Ottowia testudinis]
MKFLLLHQNFPGQWRHLAPALAARGHEVVALGLTPQVPDGWLGVRVLRYQPARGSTPGIHPWVIDVETKMIRAEAVLGAALQLRQGGFMPDAIVAHPAWGESLFMAEVWPDAPLGIYCELFHQLHGQDMGFDPEFDTQEPPEVRAARLRVKNTVQWLHFDRARAGLSPTRYQADTYPPPFRGCIQVVHEGVDTEVMKPDAAATLHLRGTTGAGDSEVWELAHGAELLTFVNRNFEPLRGCHVFMRALPDVLASRPQAYVVMVGQDGVSYGAAEPTGRGWRRRFWEEVAPRMPPKDAARVLFVPSLRRDDFTRLLQVSAVHVFLSYPFVPSWSLLEAMSCGAAVVASDTGAVREFITHAQTGYLVDFFDRDRLAKAISLLLASPATRQRLGAAARARMQAQFDLKTQCLPRMLDWVQRLCQPDLSKT